jgi:hypothetical protein
MHQPYRSRTEKLDYLQRLTTVRRGTNYYGCHGTCGRVCGCMSLAKRQQQERAPTKIPPLHGFRDRVSKIGGGHGRGFSLSAHGRQEARREAQSSVSVRNTWRRRCIARGLYLDSLSVYTRRITIEKYMADSVASEVN